MSGMNQLRSTEVSLKTAAIAILILVVLLAGGIGLYVHRAQNSTPAVPERESVAVRTRPSVKVDVKETSLVSSDMDRASEAQGTDIPAWKTISDRNIFKPIPGYSTTASVSTGGMGRSGGAAVRPMPLGVLPGFSGSGMGMGFRGMGRSSGGSIAYTGLVETPQGQMALIENTSTLETKYVSVGDEAFGMTVVDVNPRSVTLDSGMSTVRLAIGENKAALQPTAQAQQGANGQAGQQAGATGENQNADASSQNGNRFNRRFSRRSSGGGEMGGPPGGGMGMPPGQ